MRAIFLFRSITTLWCQRDDMAGSIRALHAANGMHEVPFWHLMVSWAPQEWSLSSESEVNLEHCLVWPKTNGPLRVECIHSTLNTCKAQARKRTHPFPPSWPYLASAQASLWRTVCGTGDWGAQVSCIQDKGDLTVLCFYKSMVWVKWKNMFISTNIY